MKVLGRRPLLWIVVVISGLALWSRGATTPPPAFGTLDSSPSIMGLTADDTDVSSAIKRLDEQSFEYRPGGAWSSPGESTIESIVSYLVGEPKFILRGSISYSATDGRLWHVSGPDLSLDGRPALRRGDAAARVLRMLGPPHQVSWCSDSPYPASLYPPCSWVSAGVHGERRVNGGRRATVALFYRVPGDRPGCWLGVWVECSHGRPAKGVDELARGGVVRHVSLLWPQAGRALPPPNELDQYPICDLWGSNGWVCFNACPIIGNPDVPRIFLDVDHNKLGCAGCVFNGFGNAMYFPRAWDMHPLWNTLPYRLVLPMAYTRQYARPVLQVQLVDGYEVVSIDDEQFLRDRARLWREAVGTEEDYPDEGWRRNEHRVPALLRLQEDGVHLPGRCWGKFKHLRWKDAIGNYP